MDRKGLHADQYSFLSPNGRVDYIRNRTFIQGIDMEEKMKDSIFLKLAVEYPQLYLNPDTDTQDMYRAVTLRGEEPEAKSLAHYTGDEADRYETVDTPVGAVRVVTIGNRHDFELVLRGLLAAKNGPDQEIPKSQGASMLTVFNWPRIHAHLDQFPKEERDAAFKRFTSVKENYTDKIIILSRGYYSNVSADVMGLSEKEWLLYSDKIRSYHELTHVICRCSYPGNIMEIRDELIADAVGLYAAYGYFEPEMIKKFLGIDGEVYMGGRLENYTEKAKEISAGICAKLDEMKSLIDKIKARSPFDLIPVLMEECDYAW